VIDGDTIEVHGTRIRLAGVDAPESKQECQRPDGTAWRCGQQAALALSDRIARSVVNCVPSTKDRYICVSRSLQGFQGNRNDNTQRQAR
jgi:endonuclease YncB( thermonuclease family)